MKKVFQIVLGIVILVLIYVLYDQLLSPIRFTREVETREAAVISRIKDIRSAEQAFKQKYQRYTGNFDTLINFILSDSLEFDRTIGSKDDSVAVAKGLVRTERFSIPVMDTVFTTRLSVEDVRQLPYIPYGNGEKYLLDAGIFTTESGVQVPVFECKAPYKLFLSDLSNQELVNLIDTRKTMEKYPGIKVGAMDQATNDAGNWE